MTLMMPEAALSAEERAETLDERLIEQLMALAPTKVDEPLSRHTTFGIGGLADVFVTVRNADELARAVIIAREFDAPYFILGAGSNIVVGDRGIRGVVIDNQARATAVAPLMLPEVSSALTSAVDASLIERRARMANSGAVPADEFVVWAESGTPFATLARKLARDGYTGIEWASGIPGTLGGAAVYNAGAYDGCLADVLLAVTLLDGSNETRYVPAEEMGLGYRSSAILRGECRGCVVLSLEIAVRRGDRAESERRIAEFDAQRLGAQPRGRNSGSTFKNPPGHQAWALIDAVGMRGMRIGDARVSEKHCNFFENLGAARAADVGALMREAQRRVREQFGIELQNEVQLAGEGFE